MKRRVAALSGAVLVVSLLGCFSYKVIDLAYGPWGVSADSGRDVRQGWGWIFVLSRSYNRFALARIDQNGDLAPGTTTDPWGFGLVD